MEIAFADDNEILLRMPFQNTYLDQTMPMTGDGHLPTGDIGWRDEDGYLYITGRKKNLFITSFGRNVSPEWIEGELTAEPSILQAAVFGEARPSNIAILCASGQADTDSIGAAVALANQRLPDYARIERWFMASEPFSIHNNQATANGRLRRENIAAAYRDQLDRPCNRNV
jgi:long-subunit acyl-CoA synthetase (AMP-forming)